MRGHSTDEQNLFPIAGWLFADLLLAMAIIFIAASSPKAPLPANTQQPSPTPIIPTGTALVLNTTPLQFFLLVDPGSVEVGEPTAVAYVKDQVNKAINQAGDNGYRAGFVITLAGGPLGDEHADALNNILRSMVIFQGAVFKGYHDLRYSHIKR